MASVKDLERDATEKMGKAIAFLEDEFKGVRTGRATPALVDRIKVDYYGNPTPLLQLAQITVPEPRMLALKPFDPQSVKEIEKAILKSDLGVTPIVDGKTVRIPLPPLSGEQRKKLVGRVKEMAEAAKVSLRNIRRDAMKHLEGLKEEHTSEDEVDRGKAHVQDQLKEHEKRVDELLGAKSKEILEE